MDPGRRLSLPLLLAIATCFGVSSTIQALMLQKVSGLEWRASNLPQLLALNLAYWYVPALLGPAIIALAQRYQLGRVPWSTQIAIHCGGAIVYSIVHTTAMAGVRAVSSMITGRTMVLATWWTMTRREYLMQLDWQLMTYLCFVGLGHALVYRRESEARAVDAAQLETRLVEARLQALQRQLHPHFLFNTLNTISQLMRTDVNAADRMIDRLGDLLRMTLKTSGIQEVAVKDELEALQKYLEIEQTRFGSRLSVTTHVEVSVLDALVPNLLLQPLVENAIRHGIAPHVRPGSITIEAEQRSGRLHLRVRDSGDGPPPDRLTALNHGVGLANTRARLDHLYPRAHEFVFSKQDAGFCVRVSIPFRTTRGNDTSDAAATADRTTDSGRMTREGAA
jgi:two-component system LytT family sensor kinase